METTAQDIMTTELLTIREGASIEDALKLLMNNKVTGTPVVNQAGEMIGVVSEFDILTQLSEMPNLGHAALHVPVRFTREAASISVNLELKEIVDLFIKLKYRRLPVVDQQGKLAGIITRRDLMRLFYYRARLT